MDGLTGNEAGIVGQKKPNQGRGIIGCSDPPQGNFFGGVCPGLGRQGGMSGGILLRVARRDAVYRGARWRELNGQRFGQGFDGCRAAVGAIPVR